MSKMKHFVIDADIARASGETVHPVSSSCRAVLSAIKSSKHNISMCPTLLSEWRKHNSKFAKMWLSSMIASKRASIIENKNIIKEEIYNSITESREKDIALKDAHLLDIAIEHDQIITSNDNTARKVFSDMSPTIPKIKNIAWFNAVADKDFITTKLVSEDYIPKKYKLNN